MLREISDRDGEAAAISATADIEALQGRYADALGSYQRAREIYRELGDRSGENRTTRRIEALHGRVNPIPSPSP